MVLFDRVEENPNVSRISPVSSTSVFSHCQFQWRWMPAGTFLLSSIPSFLFMLQICRTFLLILPRFPLPVSLKVSPLADDVTTLTIRMRAEENCSRINSSHYSYSSFHQILRCLISTFSCKYTMCLALTNRRKFHINMIACGSERYLIYRPQM